MLETNANIFLVTISKSLKLFEGKREKYLSLKGFSAFFDIFMRAYFIFMGLKPDNGK